MENSNYILISEKRNLLPAKQLKEKVTTLMFRFELDNDTHLDKLLVNLPEQNRTEFTRTELVCTMMKVIGSKRMSRLKLYIIYLVQLSRDFISNI